jgi:hypothetical protein
MDITKLAITEEGRVYRLNKHGRPLLLGHISGLAREETLLGREVREWWQARLASDEPAVNLVVTRKGEFYFLPVVEEVPVAAPQPDRELFESVTAAD